MPQNQPLVSLCLVLLEYISSYMYMSFTLVLLQFGCCLFVCFQPSDWLGKLILKCVERDVRYAVENLRNCPFLTVASFAVEMYPVCSVHPS